MKHAVLPWTICFVLLSACSATTPGEPSAPIADVSQPEAVNSPPQLPEAASPVAMETAPQMPAANAISFKGFGPAAFGANEENVRMAWGKDLGEAKPSEAGGCYYLTPQPLSDAGYRLAFMMEADQFSRIDVRAHDIVAPGGGRVGMRESEIEALYQGRVQKQPHKYVEGASNLRVSDSDASNKAALVFELGQDNKVAAWRVGIPPQVDYVEGCS